MYFISHHTFWTCMVQYSWGGFFKIPPLPPPPPTGGVDFLAHRGSFWYPTQIPTTTDFSSTAFPPSSLRKTTLLTVELRSGQKFILASSQWKISDVRMNDSSEFFRVCMRRKSEPLFCLRIIRLICCWINTEIFLPRDLKKTKLSYTLTKYICVRSVTWKLFAIFSWNLINLLTKLWYFFDVSAVVGQCEMSAALLLDI